jgi:ATP-dependent helicase/nuclease subunit B
MLGFALLSPTYGVAIRFMFTGSAARSASNEPNLRIAPLQPREMPMAERSAAIFTVPPGRAFLDCLAEAVLAGDLPRAGGATPAPLDLAAWTILLPTRRAARAFQEAFLNASAKHTAGTRAMLLPRIKPIAEGDEDLTLLSGIASLDSISAGAADVPPAVSEIERRLVITSLVMRWSEALRGGSQDAATLAAGASTPAQAARLAAELARLMDGIETEGASMDGFADLVPEGFSEHWQTTLQFLQIVREWWPAHLAERGLISPADRRNRLIRAEAARLKAQPPKQPVIVAGVTGSIPASAELMRVVAGLPNGAIILPGLDQALDEAGWTAVAEHPEHPQFGLSKLLRALGVARADVAILTGADAAPTARSRAAIVSEAMRPASTTDHWHQFTAIADRAAIAEALTGVSSLQLATAQEEAEAVALVMRQAAETPGQTAALVSPDRLLARRVATRLEAWGIRVDDSAGRPFAKTVPGTFLELVIDAVASRFAPAALTTLLKHPLTRLGLPAFDVRRAARALEIAAFRTLYFGRGLDGVDAALERARMESEGGRRRERAVKRLWDEDWNAARDLVARLRTAFAPLQAVFDNRAAQPLRDLVRAHVEAAEALSRLPDDAAELELWRGEAGQSASLFLTGLLDAELPAPSISAADYPDFYRGLLAGETVRSRIPVHPRLSIWGPFEARMQQPDIVILGSLNEGTWPQAADPGPWLNRPMRQQLGLPSPEEEIGRNAHDVAMLLGGARVYLTRAQKNDGVPTVPSRWLLRLDALLQGLRLGDALQPDQPWRAWAQARDSIPNAINIKAPMPRPALALRPRQLSVSDVETLMANPYAIFAARILKLDAMPELGLPPDASLRGSVIHDALGRFATHNPDTLPADIKDELLRNALTIRSDFAGDARVAAFWIPRFARFAAWFAETEAGRRNGVTKVLAELPGSLVWTAPAGPFTLKARADRIDVGPNGLVITDYKSGAHLASLAARAARGEAPQLLLEAVIAAAGGFTHLDSLPVTALRYISASGGEPPGRVIDIKTDNVASLAASAKAGLETLIAAFDDEATPYAAVRRPRFDYDYDDFAHLARVAEWSGGDDEEGGES